MIARQSLLYPGLVLILSISSFLLFYGGPDNYAIRSIQALWNLGHVVYFALLAVIITGVLNYYRVAPGRIWLICILVTSLLGVSIELIQDDIGRNFDIHDLARNSCGVLLVLVFQPYLVNEIPLRLRRFLQFFTMSFLLLLVAPLLVNISDEIIAVNQFPVLSSFETPFELQRWEGNSEFEILEQPGITSKPMMKIKLSAQKRYPGVNMEYLIGDWHNYKFISIELYFPGSISLPLYIKVYDHRHRTVNPTFRYNDRFNHRFILRTGWNRLKIKLQDIKKAPEERDMVMTEIANISLFSKRLIQPQYLYLDKIYLSN